MWTLVYRQFLFLKASWESTLVPTPFLTFYAILFRIPKHKLFQSSTDDLEDLQAQEAHEVDQQDAEQDQSDKEQQTWTISDHKSTQLHCLFQTLVYMLLSGKQITPLHIMLGHTIHGMDH